MKQITIDGINYNLVPVDEPKAKQSSRFIPEYQQSYYLVDSLNKAKFESNIHTVYDKLNIKLGNCYRTEVEAQAEADAREVIADFQICDGAGKFKLDESKYCLELEDKTLSVVTRYHWATGFASTYFNTEEELQAAIDKVGIERLTKAALWREYGEY